MEKTDKKQSILFIVLFSLLAAGIVGSGRLYYASEEKALKEASLENLRAVADLKVREISLWQKERLADASVMQRNPFVAGQIRNLADVSTGKQGALLLEGYLNTVMDQYGYAAWVIFDSDHRVVLRSDQSGHKMLDSQPWFFGHSWEAPFLSDLHVEKEGNINIDLVVPLAVDGRKYLVVFSIDPAHFLYPLIQTWPMSGTSGETALVEKSGDEILFLNDLRNRKDTALKLRVPVRPDLPAVQAVSGVSAKMEGVDYRGVNVLAATSYVDGTPWGLVTKMDVAEVLLPLRERFRFIVVSGLLLILATGLAVFFLWQRRKGALLLAGAVKYKDIAAELAETRDRLLEAQEIAHLGNWEWNIVTGGLEWSDEIYRIFGLKPREFTATYEAFLERVHPEDREKVTAAVQAAIDKNIPYETEHRVVRPNGSERTVREVGRVFRDESGRPLRMVGTVNDITDLVTSHRRLENLIAFQKAILDNAGYAIITARPDGIITTFNRAAERMLGYSAEELIGNMTPAIWHDRDEVIERAAEFSRELGKAIEPGFETFVAKARLKLPNEYEWIYIRKDGGRVPVLLNVTALWNDDGRITGFLGVSADMTRLKEAEARLKESEKRFRATFEQAAVGVALVGTDGRWLHVNQKLCDIVGYDREALLGLTFQDITHHDDLENDLENVKKMLSGELSTYAIDKRYIRKNGETIWINLTVGLVRNESGSPEYFVSVIKDISDRKNTEEALSREKETVQTYFDIAGVIFLVLTRDGTVSRINRRGRRILGYREDEMTDMNWFETFLPERDRRQVKALYADVMAGKTPLPEHYENNILTRLGEERIISWHNIPVYGQNGEISEVLSSGEDVTERRWAEQEYRTILATAMDSFWLVDATGRLVEVNDAYCRLSGYSREELLSMRIPDLEANETEADAAVHMKKIVETGYDRFETKHRTKDGRIIDIEVSTHFTHMQGGRFYAFLRDITEQNAAKQAIIEGREAAERANKAKSEFLANMSHEIRTPMTSIIGMAELLSETAIDDEQKEYVERLRHSGDALISIINDILDISKIEAGQIELEEIEFSLQAELERVLSIFRTKANIKGISLACGVSPDLPESFIGDPVRLRQILINIVGNAVKFTSSGSVGVQARCVGCGEGDDSCRLRISVSDTGIGIEREKIENIFMPFVQADTSTTRLYGGTGLGLAISKKLIDLMGGEISVESEPGKGSVFHLSLDLRKGDGDALCEAQQEGTVRPDVATKEGLKILLAEDAEDNRLLVQAFLRETSHRLDMVENGEEAFERFTAGEYDLILMDMQMPVMDGYEATRIIRKWEEDQGGRKTPIVAFTAHALKEEVDRCLRAGCTGHIAKPVRKKNLLEAIVEYGRKEADEAIP